MIVPSSGPFGATFPPGGRLKKNAANPRLSPKISAARLKYLEWQKMRGSFPKKLTPCTQSGILP